MGILHPFPGVFGIKKDVIGFETKSTRLRLPRIALLAYLHYHEGVYSSRTVLSGTGL